jgi:hypothetical protein
MFQPPLLINDKCKMPDFKTQIALRAKEAILKVDE